MKLSVVVLLKGMQSVAALVRPLALLLPAWLPAENLLSLALVLVVCLLIGIAVRTRVGGVLRQWMDRTLFERLPGYALFRSLTQRLAGEGRENAWKPALVEIEEALVPAFIIEEMDLATQHPHAPRMIHRGAGRREDEPADDLRDQNPVT